eukprot:gene1887-biopygen1565
MKETSLCSDEEYKELRAKVMKAFLSPSPGTAVPMSPAGDDLFTWDVAVLRRKDAQMRYPWARAYVEIAEELERIENDFAAPNCWDRMRTAVEDRARSMPLTLLESIVYNQLLFTGNVEKGAHSLLSLMMSPVQDRTLPLHNYMVLQGYNPSERRTLIERGLALDVPSTLRETAPPELRVVQGRRSGGWITRAASTVRLSRGHERDRRRLCRPHDEYERRTYRNGRPWSVGGLPYAIHHDQARSAEGHSAHGAAPCVRASSPPAGPTMVQEPHPSRPRLRCKQPPAARA